MSAAVIDVRGLRIGGTTTQQGSTTKSDGTVTRESTRGVTRPAR